MSNMESLAILSFVLCLASVAPQSQTVVIDCGPLFQACDNAFDASQKDMEHVDNYYQCLKRPQDCDFVQEEERERRIVNLKIFVANVCPSCRLGDRHWTTPTQSQDEEMPEETCENQIFTCTTHKHERDGMTRFNALHEIFVCVQRPTECSEEEEFLRHAVTNSIVNEMALACPFCLVPNPPPPMYERALDPENLSCRSVLTLCNAKYNVRETNYWSFESLYVCIAKISNCESDRDNTLRQQQMDVLAMTLKRICPNCTLPTPTPPKQRTCLESVYYCSTYGIDRNYTVRYNGLRKVHDCALNLDECNSPDENNLRFHLVHHVRNEMERECGLCDLPDVTAELMDSIANAMPPEHDSCRDTITSCQSIFNIRPRYQRRRYEEMYHCLQRTDDCTPEEMDPMEQMTFEPDEPEQSLQRAKRSALTYIESMSAPNMKATEVSTCRDGINDCQQEFQSSHDTCENRRVYLTCLMTLKNCQEKEEMIRMSIIANEFPIIEQECGLEKDEGEGDGSSCNSAFVECRKQFDTSNRDQRNALQFHQCLRKPQNCRDREESLRQRMLQTAQQYINLHKNTPPSEASSDFKGSFQHFGV